MEAVLFAWFFCGLLGAIVGSFRSAIFLGAVLGLVLGPLGVIMAFSADNRPKCPGCGAAVVPGRHNCQACRAPLDWDGRVLKGDGDEPPAEQDAEEVNQHPALQKKRKKSRRLSPIDAFRASLVGAVAGFTDFLDVASRHLGGEDDHNVLSRFIKAVLYLLLIVVLFAQIFGSFIWVGIINFSDK